MLQQLQHALQWLAQWHLGNHLEGLCRALLQALSIISMIILQSPRKQRLTNPPVTDSIQIQQELYLFHSLNNQQITIINWHTIFPSLQPSPGCGGYKSVAAIVISKVITIGTLYWNEKTGEIDVNAAQWLYLVKEC